MCRRGWRGVRCGRMGMALWKRIEEGIFGRAIHRLERSSFLSLVSGSDLQRLSRNIVVLRPLLWRS